MATINQITVNSTTYDLAVSAANVSGTVANATTATKLGTANKGSATQPIYLSAGAPAACTYSLAKSVPADAKFTDTTYSNFVKSGPGAAAGLVPAPSIIPGTTKYLREDGTWQTPSTSYTLPAATSSTLGGVKTSTGITNSSGTISVSYGTTANTACAGNDSRLSDSRTPKAHASTATTYGIGNASNYGHVKLSDKYTASDGAAAAGVGASSLALYNAFNALKLSSRFQMVPATHGGYISSSDTTVFCEMTLNEGTYLIGGYFLSHADDKALLKLETSDGADSSSLIYTNIISGRGFSKLIYISKMTVVYYKSRETDGGCVVGPATQLWALKLSD